MQLAQAAAVLAAAGVGMFLGKLPLPALISNTAQAFTAAVQVCSPMDQLKVRHRLCCSSHAPLTGCTQTVRVHGVQQLFVVVEAPELAGLCTPQHCSGFRV